MYSNSTTRIKLIRKLSEAIDVEVGTEQGHPMSPELFKIFILHLSEQLDSDPNLQLPELDDFKVSHLLWADDLVLLALDPVSLQNLINILGDYCDNWELEANMEKTNIMVFNSACHNPDVCAPKPRHAMMHQQAHTPSDLIVTR